MKTLLLILIPSVAMANGPLFRHKDGLVDQEFSQVYHDIKSSPLGKVKQVVSFSTDASLTTTSASYEDSSTVVQITPTSAASKVLLFASGVLRNATAGNLSNCTLTFARNTTSLDNGSGFAIHRWDGGATALRVPVSMAYYDSPATTSAITYKVQLKSSDGVGSCRFNDAGNMSTIVAIEVGGN